MKMEQILIPDGAYNSNELHPVMYGNSKIISFLLSKNVDLDKIHPDALASYYVDYYFSQVNMAGFSKFLHSSQWNTDMNDRIAYGLKEMKSFKHLEYFINKRKEINQLSADKLEIFLENRYMLDSPLREEIDEDKTFYSIDDEIVELNGQWLKEHKDTVALSMDAIFIILEEILGEPIKKG
jgi:hypothetical protein